MKNIAIYGGGGFGREVACLLRRINSVKRTWNLVGFFDDEKEKDSMNEYGKILGGINELNSITEPLSIVIAIGSPQVVQKIVSSITSEWIDFPNIFSPDTIFLDEENIKFGKGNLICSGCLFSCNINVGNFNTFNGFITVGHDTEIGNYNSLMPAVRISGNVHIGECNYFGVSSVVLQQIVIGNKTVVGANSTVIRKTKDGQTYVGNPATMVKY